MGCVGGCEAEGGRGRYPLCGGGCGRLVARSEPCWETPSSEALCPGHQRSHGKDSDPGGASVPVAPLQPGVLQAPRTPQSQGTHSETDLPHEGVPGVWMRLCGAFQQGEPATPQFQKDRGLQTHATSKLMAKCSEWRGQPGTEFTDSEKSIAIQTVRGKQNTCVPGQSWTVSQASGGAFRGSATGC